MEQVGPRRNHLHVTLNLAVLDILAKGATCTDNRRDVPIRKQRGKKISQAFLALIISPCSGSHSPDGPQVFFSN